MFRILWNSARVSEFYQKGPRPQFFYREVDMNKLAGILCILLLIGALAIGGQIACKGKGSVSSGYDWVTIDKNYNPQNTIEEFLRDDAAAKGYLPVYIKNYGKNKKILRQFKGQRFAQPNNDTVLKMMFNGMEDWMIVDLKYKNEKEQEVKRTLLYINVRGKWMLGDSGSLLE
jgi:hypothetical protein